MKYPEPRDIISRVNQQPWYKFTQKHPQLFEFLCRVAVYTILWLLLQLVLTAFAVQAQDDLPRVSPLPPIVTVVSAPPPTDTPPLSDVGQLFTPEIILMLVFLLTMPLTTLIKRLIDLQGNTANIVTNVILNALAKGVTLIATGQATWQFALMAFILGVALDKTIYDLLTRDKQEKIVQLKKDVLRPEPYGDGEPRAKGKVEDYA